MFHKTLKDYQAVSELMCQLLIRISEVNHVMANRMKMYTAITMTFQQRNEHLYGTNKR